MNRKSPSHGEPRNRCDARGVGDIEARDGGESEDGVLRDGGHDAERGCDHIYPRWSSFDSGMTSLLSCY